MMTIRNILMEVLRDGTEEDMDIDMLLSMITKVSNERYLVEAEWDRTDILQNAGEIEINERGYLIFWFVIHDDYFYIEKMDGENKTIEFIKNMYDNSFISDIVVLFNGKKKKYQVRKMGENIDVIWK